MMDRKKATKILSKVHFSLIIFWSVAAIPTVLWWKDSILWVALMSCYANIYTSASAWQASRAEKATEDA